VKFKHNVTTVDLINRYGFKRVLQAQEDYLNERHNSLCWFFIADYCSDNKCNPYFEHNYNFAKDMFHRLIKEV